MPIIPFRIPLYKTPPSKDNPIGVKIPKGERQIYEKAAVSKLFDFDDRFFIYSVRFMETAGNIQGEVDFIYIDNESILFLECKGGIVYFNSGESKWYTQGGNVEKDPFDQVCAYLIYFRNKLDYQLKSRLILGYGVMFPDCHKPASFNQDYSKNHSYYKQESTEYALQIVYDSKDHNEEKGFKEYINRLKDYWRAHGSNKSKSLYGLKHEQVIEIKEIFRKDIKFEIPILEYYQQDEIETKKYTEEQFQLIQHLIDNKDSIPFIINGGPGTGKTLIALEYARRLNKEGKNVLFICYNKALAGKLEQDKNLILEMDGIEPNFTEIFNVDRLFIQKLNELGVNYSIENSQEFWSVKLPAFFKESIKEIENNKKYDYLIIDEAQDIFNENIFEALAGLLKTGWEGKQWALFIDKNYQNIYKKVDESFYHTFKDLYVPFEFRLNKNCRNSPEIIEKAHYHTGVEKLSCLKPDDFKPIISFYSSDQDFLNQLNKYIKIYNELGIKFEDFTILTHNSMIDKILNTSANKFERMSDRFAFRTKITISTPESFKGLENRIIILGGYEKLDFDNPDFMSKMYVGYTRATTLLILLFPKSEEENLNKHIINRIINESNN